jgi:UDP-N-acetylglucosamine:LPS N-acetylglucosamine transferase
MPKTILVFYSLSGGGHYQAAKSLATDKTNNYLLVDIGGFNKFNVFLYGQLYTMLVEDYKWIWVLLNVIWNLRICRFITYLLFRISNQNYFNKVISEHQPDVIVSTYFYCSRLAHSLYPKTKCITFITELYGASPVWFDDKEVDYICCNPGIVRIGMKLGIPEERLHLFSQYYNPVYDQANSKSILDSTKFDLNLDSRPIVLIVGGGNSLPKGLELTQKLIKTNYNFQFVIICGRNATLFKELSDLTVNDKRFKILGFTDRLQSLINLAAIIVTKAGPALITEIATQQKPIILYSYIWPQEKANVDFITSNNLGVYESDLDRLVLRIGQIGKIPDFSKIQIANSIQPIIDFVTKN